MEVVRSGGSQREKVEEVTEGVIVRGEGVTEEEVVEAIEVVGVEVKVVGEEHCQEKILPRLPEVEGVVDIRGVVPLPPPLDHREE